MNLRIFCFCLALPILEAADVSQASATLIVDGKLDDSLWRPVQPRTLSPSESGVPASLGGNVRVLLRGGYICVAGHFPEPGGRVLARSFGRNPVWDRDLAGSPDVEDRVVFEFRYTNTSGGERKVLIAVNPWGAYRAEADGQVLTSLTVLAAARVTTGGWEVETAIPADQLEVGGDRSVHVSAERIRSRRALAPEFRWTAGAIPLTLRQPEQNVSAPVLRPPALGNTDPPFEIGRVPALPPVIAKWDDPAWRDVPEFELPRNEPYPRAARYATRVKWIHDGRRLALLLRMEEPEPVVARAGGRDSAVTSDDHVAIYLATSGSAFLEIAINTVGAISDARGGGPHRQRPAPGWNAAIERETDIRHGYWVARVNIPLEECAAALGETEVPREWRVLLSRLRAARPGEAAEQSALPVIGGAFTFYGPIRYRRAVLSESGPAQVARVAPAHEQTRGSGLAAEIAALHPNVWPASERRYRAVRGMLNRHLERRTEQAVLAERRAWEDVRTRGDWEKSRDNRIQGLRESVGIFPPHRPALNARVTATHKGDGYLLENVIFQVRPGSWMTANFYLPQQINRKLPAMIIVHSQHYPKTQGELHDMGELWARTGAAVLVIERPGYGERVETAPWYRQSYASRHTFTKQLFVAGESYSGWAAWDIIRSVDYLFERPEIDTGKIIVLGSVAGGGEPSGVAAALDPRITAIVPFNYDQGHVRVHGDSPGQIAGQFSPWLVAASVAPRRFVRAFEFGWEGAEEPDYPNLWFDGLQRSEKVWGFYNARENLATSQAYGLIRLSMERVSHCFSIGPQQRAELYPIFERWFGIPLPSPKDLAILPDSQLSVNPLREEARRQEASRRRPHSDFLSLPPAVSEQIQRRSMHEIAYEIGANHLRTARARLQQLSPAERVRHLRDSLKPMLGDIDPAMSPPARIYERRNLSASTVEALSITVQDGIDVPLLLLTPKAAKPAPVVVAVSQGGKARFLANRASDLTKLLDAGIAICLADVRGTGETSPSEAAGENGALNGLAQREFDLAGSLLGSRLKDLRTVIAYLRGRSELDGRRIAVWGESFSPANEAPLFLDEIEFEVGPQIQHRADPAGAHLALLAALFEPDVQAVAAQGGLAGYLNVLGSPFTYVGLDAMLFGVLKAGDIADIAAAIAPRPLALNALVDGRNVSLNPETLKDAFAATERAYADADATAKLKVHPRRDDVGSWLAAALGRPAASARTEAGSPRHRPANRGLLVRSGM